MSKGANYAIAGARVDRHVAGPGTSLGPIDFHSHDQTVHAAFQLWAAQTPAAIALRQGDMRVSYHDLDRRSNRLARILRRHGAGAGDRVGLLSARSIDAITAMLAILKAGAAFVPLDPSDPPQRVERLIRESSPALVLAQAGSAALPDGTESGSLVRGLHELLAQANNEPDGPLESEASAGDVAYVMHTSGSTGRPKGVLTPHRGVIRLSRGQTFATFSTDEIFLHLSPLAFDASTFEIWGALINGGQVAIVSDARPSLDQIASAIETYRPTTAWFTAGLFHLLVDYKLEALRPLRQILAGGDVLSPNHVRKALAGLPGCRLVNGYGPTENTTFTCCYVVPHSGWGDGPVPIGHPIAHTRVRLLDDQLRPVPDGEIGQLCAGGDGLALGYLNQAEMTAERFIDDPLTSGAKLYLTGDLSRMRADGAYEFLGRNDTQVKIDGKRVDLGEIESGLREDSRIADAVVLVRAGAESKRIAAYVRPAQAGMWRAQDAAEVIARLRTRLPAHMIPSAVVALDEFPLTPNGKVDRAALPAPALATMTNTKPANEIERAIVTIWGDVLGVGSIGIRDNFFDLGGTSLKLVEAHTRLEARLERRIQITAMFEHANAASLSRYLREEAPGDASAAKARGRRQSAFLQRRREAKMDQAK